MKVDEDRTYQDAVKELHAGKSTWYFWWDGDNYRHLHEDGSTGTGSICGVVCERKRK